MKKGKGGRRKKVGLGDEEDGTKRQREQREGKTLGARTVKEGVGDDVEDW